MEGSHQHTKRRKPRNHTEIPSTSSKDSVMATPTLPQELITAILVRFPVKYLLQFKEVEKCRKVEPPCYGEENLCLTLGVLGSDLSVLCCCNERTDMWVMKGYGVKYSWTKLYTIKCPKYVLSPPLCMSIEGEILHVLNSTLTIYNPEDDLRRYPEVTNVDGYVKAEFYIESLVCPVLQNEPVTQH